MFWVFSRHDDRVSLEATTDVHKAEVAIEIVHGDGRRGRERFAGQKQFWAWLLAMRRVLAAHGWQLTGPFQNASGADANPAGPRDSASQAIRANSDQRTTPVCP